MNAKKIFAVCAAASVIAGVAFAQTPDVATLMLQIQQLQAQLAALQGAPSMTTGSIPPFTAPLKLGMSGEAVKNLQTFLNTQGATLPTTGYFGNMTKTALANFQAANGIAPAVGYFGPITMAKVNSMLTAYTPTPVPTPIPTPIPGAEPTPTPAPTTNTEGTFDITLWSAPNGVTVKEGETKSVVGYKVKTTGGDVTLNRWDIYFNAKIWKYVNTAALSDGDTNIATVSLSADAFEEITTTQYRLRFDNLNYTLPKSSTKYFYVKLTANPVVGSTYTYTVTMGGNYARGTDGKGLSQYSPSAALSARTFYVGAATAGTIEASVYPSDIDRVVQVSDAGTTDGVSLGSFNLKCKFADCTIKTIELNIHASTSAGAVRDVDLVATIAKLYDGETLLGSASLTDSATGSSSASFSDMAIAIAKDTTKTLTVKIDAAQVKTEGVTQGDVAWFQIVANTTNITGDDANATTLAVTSNTVTGKKSLLYTAYPVLTLVSTNITKTAGDQTNTGTSDVADGYLTYKVKAVGADIYLNDSTVWTTSSLVATSSAVQASGFTMSAKDGAYQDTAAYNYIVYAGQEKTFQVSSHITPAASGQFYYYATKFQWSTSHQDTPTFTWSNDGTAGIEFQPLKDFKTDTIYLTKRP